MIPQITAMLLRAYARQQRLTQTVNCDNVRIQGAREEVEGLGCEFLWRSIACLFISVDLSKTLARFSLGVFLPDVTVRSGDVIKGILSD